MYRYGWFEELRGTFVFYRCELWVLCVFLYFGIVCLIT